MKTLDSDVMVIKCDYKFSVFDEPEKKGKLLETSKALVMAKIAQVLLSDPSLIQVESAVDFDTGIVTESYYVYVLRPLPIQMDGTSMNVSDTERELPQ